MTTPANHKPDSLKYKWLLYALVVRSDWATSLDKSVAFEIIDNYRSEHQNSEASLRYLAEATGADRTNVIASVRRVVEKGPFSVALQGAGKRGTRYKLHLELVNGTGSGVVDTTSTDLDSGVVGATSCGVVGTTSTALSGVVGTTESLLPVPVTNRVQEERDIDSSAATPLPLSGALGAARAVPDEEKGFVALWKAYDHPVDRFEAKTAFAVLPANVDHAALIASAKAWREAWREDGDADKGRRTLAVWLKREDYLAAPNRRRKPTSARHAQKACKPASNDNRAPAAKVVAVKAMTRQRVTVADATEVVEKDRKFIRMSLETKAGETIVHDLVWEHSDAKVQDAGQLALVRLAVVTGLEEVEHASCLIGRQFTFTGRMGADAYEAAA